MSSSFDSQNVASLTTLWVQEQARLNRGGSIYGPTGSGKSHAVRAAHLGGISVDLAPGPLMGQRLTVDLARQLGSDGRPVLEAAKHRGLAAGLAIADELIDGQPFVVDAAEQLVVELASPDDPATVLWQEDKRVLRNWLLDRVKRSPTFLISRWSTGDEPERYRHQAPQRSLVRWHVSKKRVELLLSRLAEGNPAASIIAHALAPLLSAGDLDGLLVAFEDDPGVPGAALRQQLGRAFQFAAPMAWQKILALLAMTGDVPRDAIEAVFDARANAGSGTEDRDSGTDHVLLALRRLQQLNLVTERAGRLSVLPALRAFGAIRALTDKERAVLLPRIAHALLAPVNHLRSLEPVDADRVLLAHSVFVALGDAGNAERTAALHVHGLVDLARRTSLNERFSDAWQQYDSVLRMLSSGEFETADRAGQRLMSYVRHYRAWNGFRSGALDDAACLTDYELALGAWPDNALWHQRVIQTLIRLGRLVEVRRAVDTAYARVEDHPRRDELLRVRPAWTALDAGALALSLELLDPVLGADPGLSRVINDSVLAETAVDADPELSPEIADGSDALLRRWSSGLLVRELSFSFADTATEGSVKLLQPLKVRVQRSVDIWGWAARASVGETHAASPSHALELLARNLAEEVRRLVATPTSDLSEKDIRRKGALLSFVDVINSDIGLHHARERWIIGRIEGNQLIPTMRRLPPIEVPPALLPPISEGLYFAHVPVYRDGVPSGPADDLKKAGNGYSFQALHEQLARMNESAA